MRSQGVIYLWLVVWRDIKSKPGRFLLLTLSMVFMVTMILSGVLMRMTLTRHEQNWHNLLSGAWLIGRVADQHEYHLTRANRISPAIAAQLLTLDGVDQSNSYSGLVYDLAPEEHPDFFPMILGLSPAGLAQVTKVPPAELLAASPDRIWIASDVMSLLKAEPGSSVRLWNRQWQVSILPRALEFPGMILMQMSKAQALLFDPNAINFVVLNGDIELTTVQNVASGMDLFPPGSRYPLLVNIPRLNWQFYGFFVQLGGILWALIWLAGAVISWEQAERTGLLRSFGGSAPKRITPLIGVLGLIIIMAIASGIILFLYGGGGTDHHGKYILTQFALHWPISVGLILIIGLTAIVPHLFFLWRQPCGPRLPQPHGPGFPIILMLGFITFSQIGLVSEFLRVSEGHGLDSQMRQEMVLAYPAGGASTGDAASGTAVIAANLAEGILKLPEVDRDRSFRSLRTWDRVGPPSNSTMNTIGIDTSPPRTLLDYAQIQEGVLHFESTSALEVILGRSVAKWLEAEPGETVHLYGRRWRVVGILAAHSYWDDVAAFPLASLSEALGRSGSPSELWLSPAPSISTDQLAAAVGGWLQTVPEAKLALSTEAEWSGEISLLVRSWFSATMWQTGAIISSILLIVLTLYNVRSDYHLREMAVFRAVGATRWQASQPLIKEGLRVSLWSAAIGILLFHGWAWSLDSPYLWDWNATVIGNASVLIATILGMTPPTVTAMRRSPLYLLQREH